MAADVEELGFAPGGKDLATDGLLIYAAFIPFLLSTIYPPFVMASSFSFLCFYHIVTVIITLLSALLPLSSQPFHQLLAHNHAVVPRCRLRQEGPVRAGPHWARRCRNLACACIWTVLLACQHCLLARTDRRARDLSVAAQL